MEILIKLFNSPNEVTNKTLIELRDTNYVRAITFAIVLGDENNFFDGIVNDILNVVALYTQRFPFDSLTEQDAKIRGLHNSLEAWLNEKFFHNGNIHVGYHGSYQKTPYYYYES